MILFGWGFNTHRKYGVFMTQECNLCRKLTDWNLCKRTTWFTLFFIPIIPYRVECCIVCKNCKGFIVLSDAEFEEYRKVIGNPNLQSSQATQHTPINNKYSVDLPATHLKQTTTLNNMSEFKQCKNGHFYQGEECGYCPAQYHTSENWDIKNVIQKVIKYHPDGFAIISIGNPFVQFYSDGNFLFLEAACAKSVPSIGCKDYEFKQFGFIANSDFNYTKQYSAQNIDLIVNEIKMIFETIYNIKFQSYKIEEGNM